MVKIVKMIYLNISKFSVLLIVLFILSEVVSKSDTEKLFISIGQSVEFKCNHNRSSLTYLRWSYQPHEDEREIDLYDFTNDEVKYNYGAQCLPGELVCVLRLLNATEESAGTYFCKVLNGNLKIIHRVELIVGSLKCQSNIGKDRQMVGENDCKEVQPDVLERTCTFEYRGNSTEPPMLGWVRKYNNGTEVIENVHSNHRKKSDIFEIKDSLEVSTNMENVVFECRIHEFSMVLPCSLPTFSVSYAKLIGLKTTQEMAHDSHENVKCGFVKSPGINCTCSWSYNFELVETKINGCNLPKNNRKEPGNYICNVLCKLSITKVCNIESTKFAVPLTEVVEVSKDRQLIVAVLSLNLIIVVLLMAGFFSISRKFKIIKMLTRRNLSELSAQIYNSKMNETNGLLKKLRKNSLEKRIEDIKNFDPRKDLLPQLQNVSEMMTSADLMKKSKKELLKKRIENDKNLYPRRNSPPQLQIGFH